MSSTAFLLAEWEQVVDAWQITTCEEYREVARLGRKTRLPEARRESLWSVFEDVRTSLADRGLTTKAGMFGAVTPHIQSSRSPAFDYAVIDESQDMSVAHLKFLAALGANRPNSLFFAGDLGQRIFQQPFSWRSLGVDIRGRSRTLRVNYRTSHQIRTQTDRLLGPVVTDVDANTERRDDTVSVFNGPAPVIRSFESEEVEIVEVAEWLKQRTTEGLAAHETAVFVRSAQQIDRAKRATEGAGLDLTVLDERLETEVGRVSVSTMDLAKGLEFRAVAVMACDDEVLPLQERIENVGDSADLQEVYDTERHLLYVACTRARDHLLVSGVTPVSEFLEDMGDASTSQQG